MVIDTTKIQENLKNKIPKMPKMSKGAGNKLPKKYLPLIIIAILIIIGIFIIVKINTNETTILLDYDENIPLATPVELKYTIYTSGVIKMQTIQEGVVKENKGKVSSSMMKDLKKYVSEMKANVPRLVTKNTKGEMKITVYNKKVQYPLEITGIKTNPSEDNQDFSDLIKKIEEKYIRPFYS